VRVQLHHIDDDGYRAIVHQRVITETRSAPEALVAEVQLVFPLRKKEKSGGGDKHRIPEGAEVIDRWHVGTEVGLQFALLTGDFNPIHWIGPWARMMGFRNNILHGFATMARTIESLNRARFDGNPARLAAFTCRFTKPITLPADVSVFVAPGGDLFVGDAVGARASLVGTFQPTE
jgi:hypothetical protein